MAIRKLCTYQLIPRRNELDSAFHWDSAFHEIDLCLLKDIHFMSLVTSNQGAKLGVAAEIAEGAPREQQQVQLMRHHAMHRKMRFQKRQRSYEPGCSSG
jgi:hypothetical protein